MRCTNCGWNDNPDGQENCVKCNTPLTAATSNNIIQNTESKDLSGTVKGAASPLIPWDKESNLSGTLKSDTGLNCTTCGYLLREDSVFCPNCGAKSETVKQETSEIISGNSITRKISSESQSNYKGTINPYTTSKPATCFLKIVPRKDEPEKVTIEIEGNASLSRENLDPQNNTITGKEQASLEFKDGSWYITNKSEQGTTFIQIHENYKLNKGDIILMGDRKFEFDC